MARTDTPDNSPLVRSSRASGGSPGSDAENVAFAATGSSNGELSGLASRPDAAASRVAAGQRTLATTAQLLACGLGDDAVAHRLKAGRLHVVFRGVYSVGCGELPPLARELGALLACGNGAFLSHRSSAFVWGLRSVPPTDVEVSVVGRGCRSRQGLRVHRIQALDRRELRREDGLWLSSPARAALEIAAVGTRDELIEVIDAALATRRFTPRDLEAVLARNRGRRGAARLAAVIGDESAMTITRSRAEKAMLKLIHDARLPRPDVNKRLGPYRPDFLWRRERLIVELDSYGFHGGPSAFQHDREKDLFYRDAGFDVLRFTRWHIIHEPAIVLARLVRALTRRSGG